MKRLLRHLPLADMAAQGAWAKLTVTSLILAALAALPFVVGFDGPIVNILLYVAIYAVLALGLNVVVGYTGLLDLGYVTFLATGAIVTIDLLLLVQTPGGLVLPVGTTESFEGDHPFGFEGGYLLVILIAGSFCAILGMLRGIPTLRLTGDYYAIVTLGLAEIVFLIFLNSESWTGGAFGIKLAPDARPSLFGEKLYYDTRQFYFFVMLFLGLTVVVMDRLSRSRVGRAWAAIRLDETAARACGINVSRYKMIAFAVSGFFGGVGGALFVIWSGTVAVKALDVWQSILILCAVVLGGMGSIRGVLLGSAILFSLREVLREELFGVRVPPEASFLVYGLLLIFVMRFRPQGLLPRGKGESQPMTADQEAELRESRPRLFGLSESDAGTP